MGCLESQQGGIEESRGRTPTAKNAARMGKRSEPELVYFELEGKAGPIRMMLAHGKVKYTDKRLSLSDRTEFLRMKESGELPGGQVPVWFDENGNAMN